MVIEISKYLTGALQWDEVVGIVVGRVRLDAWPILRGLRHIAWELCLVAMSTIGTILDLGLVFGHFHLYWREIKYLALVGIDSLHVLERGVAPATLAYPMHLGMLWVRHLLECMPFVSDLTAALPATRLPQTPGARRLETIARRRLAAVLTVLGQLVLQLLDHLLQLPNGFSLLLDTLNQVAHQLDNSVLALSVSGSNFFVSRQLYGGHLITV